MIKEFMKRFSAPADNEAQAEQQKEEVTMTTPTEQAAAPAENVAELAAQLATVTATLAEKEKAFAELTAKFAEAQATLEAAEAAKADLAAKAAEKRLQERTEAIAKAVGNDKVDALLAATDGMADEQFNTIVSAMAASFDAEAKTELFTEQGASAQVDPANVEAKPTHFNTFIKK